MLTFALGEAYHFDWSREFMVPAGATTPVNVAHMRLAFSRMPFLRTYLRQSQEMVFGSTLMTRPSNFKGACTRRICDYMKAAVDGICR
jgi:hypothetical protein